jgi:hypothetical protein
VVAAAGLLVVAAACVPAPPPPSPPFVITGESFNPPIEGTTFVQSQPGQPLGTPAGTPPCSLYPNLPTETTATATVAPVNGQVPDRVVVNYLAGNDLENIPLQQTSPGSITWTGTIAITDGRTFFVTNPMNFYVSFAAWWHWIPDSVPDMQHVGVVRACS